MVERIVDGDTFWCRGGPKVRLIGIDAPEHGQGTFGVQSEQALAELLPRGKPVRLERDVDLLDRYGRRLAYAWDGAIMINERMLAGGWAVILTYPPNVRYVDRFVVAQDAARKGRAGLWAQDGFSCVPFNHRHGDC